MDLKFVIFTKHHFPEYLSWFKDPELNKHLGPMQENDEWLTFVLDQQLGLTETKGQTYSVFHEDKLVGVIGIDFPDINTDAFVISSLAVRPVYRGTGIGKAILKKITEILPYTAEHFLITYVSDDNGKALEFFLKNGWSCISKPPENNNMFLLKKQ